MSDTDNNNGNEVAKQRLLKANNVQRRRFEKMANELINRGSTQCSADAKHKKAIIYNQHVEKAMGAELPKLLEIRSQIQAHKQEIEKLRKIGDIRRRLNKRGIRCSAGDDWSTSYRGIDYGRFEFYLDPPAVDEKSQDVCEIITGNPVVQLRLMDCANNPPYAKYEEAVRSLDKHNLAYQNACKELEADIWAKVTTDEIIAAMSAFKDKWL